MSKKLFVGNLPFEVNDSDLKTVFAVIGTVVSAHVVLNKKTGRSKGFGFVELETDELAAEAIRKFEGATLNERALTEQLATPIETPAKAEAVEVKKDEASDPGVETSAPVVETSSESTSV